VEVAADGADVAPGRVPDFVKSLPVWKALDENTIVAYELNGQPLPRWNGFPARLVVPGWASSYWVKHLVGLEVSPQPFKGFWMQPAYRLPKGVFAVVDRFASQETETETTIPITDLVVNSLLTSPGPGARLARGKTIPVRGVAWDGGGGISSVEVSTDGKVWQPARLGKDLGRYAWRPWSFEFKPSRPGSYTLSARATNRIGQTQTRELVPNPSGYHHNVIQRVTVTVS
jgi:DMSO/TMAO reductase YedYZ molybdopterin-dependent catalytic subunit